MALGSMRSGFNSWGDQKNKIVLTTLFFIQPDGKSWECSMWGMLWGITLLKPYAKNTHVVGCFAITNRMRFFVSFTRKNNSCVGRWQTRCHLDMQICRAQITGRVFYVTSIDNFQIVSRIRARTLSIRLLSFFRLV